MEIASFPPVIRIEPASACNLKCSHCPTGTVEIERGIMHPEVFDAIIPQLEQYAESIRAVVLYHGGEPLLNKQLFEYARWLKECGVKYVKTVSNGMILGKKQIDGFCEGFIDSLEISLDMQTLEDNNRIRRKADGMLVVENVKNLLRCKAERGLQKPDICISSTQFVPLGGDPSGSEAPKPEWVRKALGDDLGLLSEFKTTWAMAWPHMVVEDQYEVHTAPSQAKAAPVCDHVLNTFNIRWNGDVVPCCYDLTSRMVLGNVLKQSILEIWSGAAFASLRASLASRNYLPLCAKCNVVSDNRYLILREVVAT